MTYKLVYGLLDHRRDFKQGLSGGGVNLKIFPEAEGLVTCTMEGVKPSSSQEAELVNNLISKLLREGEGVVVSGRSRRKERKTSGWELAIDFKSGRRWGLAVAN